MLSCEVKVDKNTLKTFFRAFSLSLEAGDYTGTQGDEANDVKSDASAHTILMVQRVELEINLYFNEDSAMTSIPCLLKDKFEPLHISTQVNAFGTSPINYAFTAVAQEVAGLLQHTYPFQADGINPTQKKTGGCSETVAIRVIELEYRQIIEIEPLTKRELEVLQLIVDGCSNSVIADKLYISTGTVKSHVRNILKKLC